MVRRKKRPWLYDGVTIDTSGGMASISRRGRFVAWDCAMFRQFEQDHLLVGPTPRGKKSSRKGAKPPRFANGIKKPRIARITRMGKKDSAFLFHPCDRWLSVVNFMQIVPCPLRPPLARPIKASPARSGPISSGFSA